MPDFLRFAHKSISTCLILMLVMLGIQPHAVSAQVNQEREKTILFGPPQDQLAAPAVGTNLFRDPSFDNSYKSNQYWIQALGDTICIWWDPACGLNGAGYHSGGGWACFGCLGSNFDDIYQDVTFPRCGADLEFYLYIGLYIGPGQQYGWNNYFTASIDNTEVFRAYGSEVNSYQPYTKKTIPLNQFANGAVHRVRFHSENLENFLWFNLDDVALKPTIPPSSGCAAVAVTFGQTLQGTYGVPKNAGERQSFPIDSGPVFVNSTNSIPFIASERVAFQSGNTWKYFSEMMGLPDNLKSTKYAFPAYDNSNFDSQIRFANVGNTSTQVTVTVAGAPVQGSPYTLLPGQGLRRSYALNSGPVVVQSSGAPIVASLRVMPKPATGSFSEIIGVTQGQLATSYVFPWYNNVELNTQLRVANVGNAATTVTVTIPGMPAKTFGLAPNASTRVSYPGINSGPVKVTSSGGVPIVASMRVLFPKTGTPYTSFSEMMGLPESQLATGYVFPWYNNVDLNTQLRFGNVSFSNATVRVYIGGQEVAGSPFTLVPGQSLRRSFAVNRGPVVVRSTNGVKIIASLRVLFPKSGTPYTSFSELMGLPESQVTTNYIFPHYNNLAINTQLRFGVP